MYYTAKNDQTIYVNSQQDTALTEKLSSVGSINDELLQFTQYHTRALCDVGAHWVEAGRLQADELPGIGDRE